jgi:hypothetical protein
MSSVVDHIVNGLHPQNIARTPKLARLPTASPLIKQKDATVAATSTSSLLPFSLGLCSSDGAAIMHRLDTHPFVHPKASRIKKNRVSELIVGGVGEGAPGLRWILHMRKSGMKRVRENDMVRILLADQIKSGG